MRLPEPAASAVVIEAKPSRRRLAALKDPRSSMRHARLSNCTKLRDSFEIVGRPPGGSISVPRPAEFVRARSCPGAVPGAGADEEPQGVAQREEPTANALTTQPRQWCEERRSIDTTKHPRSVTRPEIPLTVCTTPYRAKALSSSRRQWKNRAKALSWPRRQCLCHDGSGYRRQRRCLRPKAVQGKGSVFATKAVEEQIRGRGR